MVVIQDYAANKLGLMTVIDTHPVQLGVMVAIHILTYMFSKQQCSISNTKLLSKIRRTSLTVAMHTYPDMRGHGPSSKAFLAAFTAISTSSLSASAMLAITSPDLGSRVSNVFPETKQNRYHYTHSTYMYLECFSRVKIEQN